MKGRVLVVEDDATLAKMLHYNLTFEGFSVECVADGDLAYSRAKAFAPDLILLDIMLPGLSGFDLCRTLRGGQQTPIIILSARGQQADKLRGLGLGADDYVTKPFELQELLARIHAVLRRTYPPLERLALGPVTVDFGTFQAWNQSQPVQLTRREFELLRYLAERPKSVVHRDELLRAVWGFGDQPRTRAVDYAVARLRKKIERDPHHPRFIHTVHGDGYSLTPGD